MFSKCLRIFSSKKDALLSLKKRTRTSAKIKELGEQPPIKIDKIEYKFEQLKIDSLDGTLNIGLNPLTPDNLEDIIINEKPEVTFPQGAQPQGQPPQGEQPGQPGGPGPQNPSLKPLNRQLEKQWASDIHETILNELNQYGFSMVQHVLDERSMMIDESYYEFILEDIKSSCSSGLLLYTASSAGGNGTEF